MTPSSPAIRGDKPRINPLALASAGQAIFRLDAMGRKVPVDAPWKRPQGGEMGRPHVESWLSPVNVPGPAAPDLLETTFHALFSCDLSEVSLLSGGAQTVPEAVAAELGDAVLLEDGRRDLGGP